MEEKTQLFATKSYPKAVMTIYETFNESEYKQQTGYYVEVREINEMGLASEAKPASIALMRDIAKSFNENYSPSPFGTIPPTLLFADSTIGHERYVWYNPPQKRMMYFVESLKMEDKEYNMPGFIYEVYNNNLRVFSFKGKKPTEATEILSAPAFNTSRNGDVCTGTAMKARPAKCTWEKLMLHWENIFWNSLNSHLGSTNPVEGNLTTILKECSDKPFNCSVLKKQNKTLKQLLEKRY